MCGERRGKPLVGRIDAAEVTDCASKRNRELLDSGRTVAVRPRFPQGKRDRSTILGIARGEN